MSSCPFSPIMGGTSSRTKYGSRDRMLRQARKVYSFLLYSTFIIRKRRQFRKWQDSELSSRGELDATALFEPAEPAAVTYGHHCLFSLRFELIEPIRGTLEIDSLGIDFFPPEIDSRHIGGRSCSEPFFYIESYEGAWQVERAPAVTLQGPVPVIMEVLGGSRSSLHPSQSAQVMLAAESTENIAEEFAPKHDLAQDIAFHKLHGNLDNGLQSSQIAPAPDYRSPRLLSSLSPEEQLCGFSPVHHLPFPLIKVQPRILEPESEVSPKHSDRQSRGEILLPTNIGNDQLPSQYHRCSLSCSIQSSKAGAESLSRGQSGSFNSTAQSLAAASSVSPCPTRSSQSPIYLERSPIDHQLYMQDRCCLIECPDFKRNILYETAPRESDDPQPSSSSDFRPQSTHSHLLPITSIGEDWSRLSVASSLNSPHFGIATAATPLDPPWSSTLCSLNRVKCSDDYLKFLHDTSLHVGYDSQDDPVDLLFGLQQEQAESLRLMRTNWLHILNPSIRSSVSVPDRNSESDATLIRNVSPTFSDAQPTSLFSQKPIAINPHATKDISHQPISPEVVSSRSTSFWQIQFDPSSPFSKGLESWCYDFQNDVKHGTKEDENKVSVEIFRQEDLFEKGESDQASRSGNVGSFQEVTNPYIFELATELEVEQSLMKSETDRQ